MKDDFIPGGECLGTYSSEKGFVPNPKYSEHIKSDTQKYLEKKTVSSVGFKTPRRQKPKVNEEGEKLERLVHLKNERTRLERQLENLNRVIENLEND